MSTTSNLFRRSMTSIDRFRKAKPVAQKSRRSRASMRPGIDNLDERILMAGNVLADYTSIPGTLWIRDVTGGNNTIQIAPSSGTQLRVTGVATSVNSVAFKDFTTSNFTKLLIDMGSGKDSVSLTNFKIGTSIQITTSGTSDDKISIDSVTTSSLTIYSNNLNPPTTPPVPNPKSSITLTNDTITSSLMVYTGNGDDSVKVMGGKMGNVAINTGDNLNQLVLSSLPLPVDAVFFAPLSAKAVSITAGTGDHAINVDGGTNGMSLNSLVICTGNSPAGYACECTTLHNSYINVNNVNILKSVTGFVTPPCFTLCSDGTIINTNSYCPPSSLYISAGDNTNVMVNSVTGWAGDMNIKVGNNTWPSQFDKVLTFYVTNSNAKAMHFLVGDGDYDIVIADDNAIGGTGFTLDTQSTSGLGDKTILLSNLTVDGVSDPIFGDSIFVVVVSGNPLSNNNVSVDRVNVDVTSSFFSFITGNFGALNTYIEDDTSGTSSGFDVFGFSGEIYLP